MRPSDSAPTRATTFSWLRQSLIALGGLCAAFLILEVGFRLITSSQGHNSSTHRGAAPSKEPGETQKGMDPSRQAHKERPKRFFFPSPGRHAQDYRYPKNRPPHTYRIAVIGDSFSFAPRMQFDDAFSKRLERWLNLNDPSLSETDQQFTRAEVLNFGIPGTNTAQQVDILSEALTFDPQLVVLQITLNDAQLRPLNTEPEDVQRTYGRLPPNLDAWWVTRYSRIARFVASRLHNQATIRNYVQYHHDLFAAPESSLRFDSALDRMAQLVAEAPHQPQFVALVFPLFDFPIDKDYPFRKVHQTIADRLKTRGLRALDLRRTFSGLDVTRLQLIPGEDSHPNEIAHRLAAEALLGFLQKESILPRSLLPQRVYSQRDHVFERINKRRSRSDAN